MATLRFIRPQVLQLCFGLALIILVQTYPVGAQDITLVKTRINDEISLLVPDRFIPMGPQDIRSKFISYREPLAGFTSEDRSTDLVINVSKTPWSNQDMELLKDFYENNIRNLFDEVTFHQNELQDINGRDYAVFEFSSTVSGDPNSLRNKTPVYDYRYVLYTVDDFNVYVFTFYCPARSKDLWQPTAHQIMSGIEFK
ncbi:MAG: hypothetical protein DHS20C17_12660 [Cyclobacteriaceae bacterium]|nr:MAG: hypothetical protein DHS20C17_12660 [Cyclobacteriaceae bacterium]